MNELERAIAVLMLLSIAPPAWILVYVLKPSDAKNILRGGEVSLALALALGVTFRLFQTIAASSSSVTVFVGLVISAVIWLLLWSRVIQVLRHYSANRAQVQLGKQVGIDAEALLEQEKRERTP